MGWAVASSLILLQAIGLVATVRLLPHDRLGKGGTIRHTGNEGEDVSARDVIQKSWLT
jgi:hypothetical protein